jgi:CRP/FNR family transcriptional regulator
MRKEQIILYQGEAAQAVYVIRSGMIRAYTILSNGSEVNVALYGEGDYFPVETVYDTAPAVLFYYEALSDCLLESYDVEVFHAKRLADSNTVMADNRRYVGALLHVNALGQASAYDKLAHTLRYLAMRFGTPLPAKGFMRIDVRLTQQDLANLCTVSRETVSIELAKLKARHVVMERKKMYTIHIPQLNQLLGDDTATSVKL